MLPSPILALKGLRDLLVCQEFYDNIDTRIECALRSRESDREGLEVADAFHTDSNEFADFRQVRKVTINKKARIRVFLGMDLLQEAVPDRVFEENRNSSL